MKVNINHYSFAIISLKNLLHNLNIIRSRILPNTEIVIPVKCNAYGFGMIEISKFVIKQGIKFLSVAFPFEAFILRKNNIKSHIIVFNEPIYDSDAENMVKLNITPTLFTKDTLIQFNKYGKKYKKKVPVHINIDTGMGRIGVPFKESLEFILYANTLRNIKIEGIYSHLSAADENNTKFTKEQFKKFDILISQIKEYKIFPKFFHIYNSAAIINYPPSKYNMVRPGIMFYGYFPDNNIKEKIDLMQGISLKSFVTFVKNTEKGTPISYGHTYWTKGIEKVSTVSCGYGDGVNRLLSNNGYVLIQGKKCKIIGRICMDQFMVKIPPSLKIKKGDTVTIFGNDNGSEIRLEQIAKNLKSIPYEILCNIGERVKRIYV